MSQNNNTVNNVFENMMLALDASQLQAVYSEANALRITAGPGTGKTFVLVCRVLKWVLLDGIDPSDVIVLTFTRNAADDLKGRFTKVLGREAASHLNVGTFHSICKQYLAQDRRRNNLPPIDIRSTRQECLELIRLLQRDDSVNIDESRRQAHQATRILDTINKAKRHGISPEEYFEQHSRSYARLRDYATLYMRYQRLLIQHDLFDFDEVLFQCLILLKNDPTQLFSVKKVVVDNYQDINPLLRQLVNVMSRRRSITIAGDEQQAIFGWRYAGGMTNPNYLSISLQLNYRSTQMLLQATTEIIGRRTITAAETLNPQGVPVSLLRTDNVYTQANIVATEILRLVNASNGLIKYSDCAVLLRTHSMSLRFEEVFRDLLIPYKIVHRCTAFFLREEVMQIVDYLNFSLNPRDTNSFRNIINVPKRGISIHQIDAICQSSRVSGKDILDTLKAIAAGDETVGGFSTQEQSKLKRLADICTDISTLVQEQKDIEDILDFLVGVLNYQDHMKRSYGNHEERWSNVQELCSMASEFRQAGGSNEDQFRRFVRHCVDRRNVRNDVTVDEKCQRHELTIELGCEWPCVFIPSCIEGIIPIFKPNERIDIEEERRLLYVAMTGARFFLYCIMPGARFVPRFGRQEQPSRFLGNMRGPHYSSQVPVWNHQVCSMLALTLGRSIPAATNPRRYPQTQ
ncbi:hypothetical protein MUCCIDRAFT_113380 [Mucor lusitanicus CBS 277.49]|uniref:DNA 3'-5' helicase n=1 Tax=Mucor lusitanicus CBS 277.49 TaxID=747725 RepID=A0A168IGH0_MUCCL|nr:hypothetical protein MUCCIDRAFT_113380 [Mucor lusitanicus CBS 277.49]